MASASGAFKPQSAKLCWNVRIIGRAFGDKSGIHGDGKGLLRRGLGDEVGNGRAVKFGGFAV